MSAAPRVEDSATGENRLATLQEGRRSLTCVVGVEAMDHAVDLHAEVFRERKCLGAE